MISVAKSMSKKGRRNGISLSLNSDEISEDTWNEELNKLFLVKIQFRENYTRLRKTWRSRIWNDETQNTHYLSHSMSLNLKDDNY